MCLFAGLAARWAELAGYTHRRATHTEHRMELVDSKWLACDLPMRKHHVLFQCYRYGTTNCPVHTYTLHCSSEDGSAKTDFSAKMVYCVLELKLSLITPGVYRIYERLCALLWNCVHVEKLIAKWFFIRVRGSTLRRTNECECSHTLRIRTHSSYEVMMIKLVKREHVIFVRALNAGKLT